MAYMPVPHSLSLHPSLLDLPTFTNFGDQPPLAADIAITKALYFLFFLDPLYFIRKEK